MDWFRSWHGAPTDFRWLYIAKRAGVKPGEVSAVLWALLDHASANSGSIINFDYEGYADFSEIPKAKVLSITDHLRNKGVINGNQFRPYKGRLGWFEGDNRRPSTDKWSALRKEVFKRDGFKCTYCGEVNLPLECDHVVPVAKGGSHELDNLTTACRPCNRDKRDQTLDEWRQ